MERRLAAILFADVVGYSRLMEVDEAGTHDALMACRRELIDPAAAAHNGRIVKSTGDGVLAEFASVVDAVRCAVELQEQMNARNADVPKDRRIDLRMGLNLGDIIAEDDDIYGDGVNVAARLEGLAEPGGICLSADTYRQVRGRINVEVEDLGERELKNMAQPIRVYRIASDSFPTAFVEPAKVLSGHSDKPSVAVLPFTNVSGDPEQEYFSDGITEDIITELSRFREFAIVARNSTFHYKGHTPKAKDVGRDLGVKFVVQGSVRRAADRVRVTAQLIDSETEHHIWADRYDRELAGIFEIQDEIAEAVVARVAALGNSLRSGAAVATLPYKHRTIRQRGGGQAALAGHDTRSRILACLLKSSFRARR